MGVELISKHQIGDIALFQPDERKIDWEAMTAKAGESIECKIVAVKFTETKVLYDIAIKGEEGEFYESLPFIDIDSVFVHSKEEK